ncbi:TcpQ domain-containing protein [Burkholderia cenocepacia]|uniref:TcpQ domain-containing protein n=1 Tax=Burkholderia cenocepacia TaxID=95486 RepID=UPI002874AEFF|nr:TcpQ domain-containing protein [Burkholderia cenocepacia]MDS0807030.1 toxin co-regulated pilus biosynthesis Q family protein [Burkholderia cenocepacia]
MKKSTLLQRGAAAALALVVPFAAAQGHKNQAFVPGAAAVAAAPASGAAVTVANNSYVATVVAGGDAGIPQTTQEFAVRASDENFRKLIARWGREAGWNSEWDVDRDIDITGEYTWRNMSFVDAVRATLKATERGDLAVHGCYYANNWVQVVPLTTPCKR